MSSLAMMSPSIDKEVSSLVPRLPASEVADRLIVMRRQEQTTYRCPEYLSQHQEETLLRSTGPQQQQIVLNAVDEDCRAKMCQWCYQVNDFCEFSRETVGVGMSYLDRYLTTAAGRPVLSNRKQFQLAAMTTLYMAIKLFEPLEMETTTLSDLSRGCYTEAEISQMEQSILTALQWHVHGPTPLGFVQHFLALLPENSVAPSVAAAILDFSRYQTELAVADYFFVPRNQSSIALASILNVMERMDRSILPKSVQDAFLRNVATTTGISATTSDVVEVQNVLRASFVASTGGFGIFDALERLAPFASGNAFDAGEDKIMTDACSDRAKERRDSAAFLQRKEINRRDTSGSPVCVIRN